MTLANRIPSAPISAAIFQRIYTAVNKAMSCTIFSVIPAKIPGIFSNFVTLDLSADKVNEKTV